MVTPPNHQSSPQGWTVLEMVAVLVIIGILTLLLIPVTTAIRQKTDAAACMGNLRGLHMAASAYMEDHKQWPQIPLYGEDMTGLAKRWVTVFEPYGLPHKAWICPSIQRALEGPDYTSEDDYRTDYFGTPFDNKPRTPYTLVNQPWFAERGGLHGNGNLMIFADGSIRSLRDILAEEGRIMPAP